MDLIVRVSSTSHIGLCQVGDKVWGKNVKALPSCSCKTSICDHMKSKLYTKWKIYPVQFSIASKSSYFKLTFRILYTDFSFICEPYKQKFQVRPRPHFKMSTFGHTYDEAITWFQSNFTDFAKISEEPFDISFSGSSREPSTIYSAHFYRGNKKSWQQALKMAHKKLLRFPTCAEEVWALSH